MSKFTSGETVTMVDRLLGEAVACGASDLHLDPSGASYTVRHRIDGLLETVDTLDASAGRAAVVRLMVMAGLLTYRPDIPQEGRLASAVVRVGEVLEFRVAVMPTHAGLRAVVRLPAELIQPRHLADLQLGETALGVLEDFAAGDSGMLLLTGPAGSGKTTTIYALLQHILDTQSGLSIVSLEDPVERELPGVTQIEVRPHGELTYEVALRSILRQDPQILVLGEIRDHRTAAMAIEAAMTGHRLISTLHAGDPAETVVRLLEMSIPPYQVASVLRAVISLRLVRQSTGCTDQPYAGRVPIAEAVRFVDQELREAILERADAGRLRGCMRQMPGYRTLREEAEALVKAGRTDQQEITRVLGHRRNANRNGS